MVQFSARAARIARATACSLSAGSAPGRPRQTGHTLLFGGAPNSVEQQQNALVRVESWTCTSSPTIISYDGVSAVPIPAEPNDEPEVIGMPPRRARFRVGAQPGSSALQRNEGRGSVHPPADH